jgi:hypothetical protein
VRRAAGGLLLLLATAASACGGDDENGDSSEPARQGIDPADYTANVDHPLVPLASVRLTRFKGREGDTKTAVVSRVLNRTRRVAGVPVTIVDVREFEDGELVEHTEDYYAQDREGTVWYFGETVDDIEFMPAEPKPGQRFEQERAPGIAEDRSEVEAVGVDVETAAGRFDDCIKTKDFAPLDKRTELKTYCPGVGLVREQAPKTVLDLVGYR